MSILFYSVQVMTTPTFLRVTPLIGQGKEGESKYMITHESKEGYIPKDPNQNGYYHVANIGKVNLVQTLTKTDTPARKFEHTEADILNMRAPLEANCVLRNLHGGIAYAIYQVLTTTEWVDYMTKKKSA